MYVVRNNKKKPCLSVSVYVSFFVEDARKVNGYSFLFLVFVLLDVTYALPALLALSVD